MTTPELQEHVTQLHTHVFGVEGSGGLTKRVDTLETRVEEHESRLNAVSVKWLILMGLAGALGNGLGSALLKTLQSLP